LKVSTTLSLSCVLLGLAALPTLAQQPTDTTSPVNRPTPVVLSKPQQAADAVREPIRIAPVSVLPASLRTGGRAACEVARPVGAWYPTHANGITIGGFLPTDVPDGVETSVGFSVSLERIVSWGDRTEVVASLRYSIYSFNTSTAGSTLSGDVNLISPMVGYRYRLDRERRLYVEPGIGIVFTSGRDFNGNSNQTDFAYSFAAGYEFQSDMFVDLRYVAGGNSEQQGFIFSLGRHF